MLGLRRKCEAKLWLLRQVTGIQDDTLNSLGNNEGTSCAKFVDDWDCFTTKLSQHEVEHGQIPAFFYAVSEKIGS